jgi:hypothetical protein
MGRSAGFQGTNNLVYNAIHLIGGVARFQAASTRELFG